MIDKKDKRNIRNIPLLILPLIIFINIKEPNWLMVFSILIGCANLGIKLYQKDSCENEKIVLLLLFFSVLGIMFRSIYSLYISELILLCFLAFCIINSIKGRGIYQYLDNRKYVNVIVVVISIYCCIFEILLLMQRIPQIVISIILLLSMQFVMVISCALSNVLPVIYNFKKNDWSAAKLIKAKRSSSYYDAIIVGGGLGGLACAALLAKGGLSVLLLERQNHVGGFCTTFQRKGYKFNTGVEDVSGVWEKGSITRLFEKLNLEKSGVFKPNTSIYYYNQEKYVIPGNLMEIISFLQKKFPDESESIPRFFEDALLAYEECYEDTDMYGTPLPPELIQKVGGILKLLRYPKDYPHFYQWMNKSYRDKLEEYFSNRDLIEILCTLLVYIGTTPEKTPARNGLAACVSYYLKGGCSIIGGAGRLSELLENVIKHNNGKILLNTEVNEIICSKGKVEGVLTNQDYFYAPIVISNVNAKTTYTKLISGKNIKDKLRREMKTIKMSKSYFMLFLGIDMDLSDYPVLLKNIDEGWEIVFNSNVAPGMAPKGCGSVTVLVSNNICYSDFPDRNTKEYQKKKFEIEKNIIKKIGSFIPELEKHIVVRESATPKTFERYNLMPEGAVYSIDQSIDVQRPFFKAPIKGLYLVGASVFPGAGVEAAIISGMICANDIFGWK